MIPHFYFHTLLSSSSSSAYIQTWIILMHIYIFLQNVSVTFIRQLPSGRPFAWTTLELAVTWTCKWEIDNQLNALQCV